MAELVARELALSDDAVEEVNQCGQSRFRNDLAWARYYLCEDGYIDSSRRGVWTLTEKGRHSPELSDEAVNELAQRIQAADARRQYDVDVARGDVGSDTASGETIRVRAVLENPGRGFVGVEPNSNRRSIGKVQSEILVLFHYLISENRLLAMLRGEDEVCLHYRFVCLRLP